MALNSKMLETAIKTQAKGLLKTCVSMVPDASGAMKPVNIFDATSVQSVMGVDIKTVVYKGKPMTGIDALVEIMSETIATQVVTHIQSMAQVQTTVTTTVAPGIPVQVAVPAGTGASIAPGTGTGAGTGKVL